MAAPGHSDVAVLGDINPDLVFAADDLTVAFGQRESLVDAAALTLGGSASIAACAMARLGLATAMVGLVGDDTLGRFCIDALDGCGVDCAGVAVHADVATAATVVLQRREDRAIVTYPGTIRALAREHIDEPRLRGARHIHVGACFLLEGLRDDLPDLLAGARRAGVTVSLDPNWDPTERFALDDLLPHVDVLLPNADEARRIAGTDDLSRAVADLARRVPVVAVTDATAGAVVAAGGRRLHAEALPVAPAAFVDPIGAGDAFDAGFVAGYLDGADLGRALALGLATAAHSVTGRGGTGGQPTRAQADALADRVTVRA